MAEEERKLISNADVARLLKVTPSRVSQWRRSEKHNFPKPVAHISPSGSKTGIISPHFDESEVLEWHGNLVASRSSADTSRAKATSGRVQGPLSGPRKTSQEASEARQQALEARIRKAGEGTSSSRVKKSPKSPGKSPGRTTEESRLASRIRRVGGATQASHSDGTQWDFLTGSPTDTGEPNA